MAASVRLAQGPIGLDVAFRGDRPYLHSTSIFNAILRRLRNPVDIRFVIRRMVDRGLILAAEDDGREAIGAFRCVDGGVPVHFHLCVDGEAPMPRRGPSNETGIVANAVLSGGAVFGEVGQPGSFVETVVDLHKHLILSTVRTDRKLLFCELTTSHVPKKGTVAIDRLVCLGARMFRSRVTHEGVPLGQIVFMGADA